MPRRDNEGLYLDLENPALKAMRARIGDYSSHKELQYCSSVEGVNSMRARLHGAGGSSQQNRMIQDKKKSLNKAILYSYQSAQIKKYQTEYNMDSYIDNELIRCLINPNKLKPDYDDKIISVGYEYGFKPGDIFEWIGTNTHWIIYLQDLTELAYFRGDIRKCSYEISWKNSQGNIIKTYAAIRGPVETRINSYQKHGISFDGPNYSLHLLIPKNPDTLEKFKRYSKFYLTQDKSICWRVEAIDSISMPGIIEINATEYYSNKDKDNLEEGIVDGLVVDPIDPNKGTVSEFVINGETFIKPKKEYIYYIDSALSGDWYISNNKLPVEREVFEDEENRNAIKIKWTSSYSGQFDLWYGDSSGPLFDYKKTIIVESLF